jgi:hypothetical protein
MLKMVIFSSGRGGTGEATFLIHKGSISVVCSEGMHACNVGAKLEGLS